MKNTVLILLCLTAAAWAQFEWPNQQVPVRIDGQLVRAFWREGRAYVEREAVLSLLHIRSGPDQLDLAETLHSKGYVVTQLPDGSIDCSRPQIHVDLPAAAAPVVRRSRGPSASQHQRDWQNQQRDQARAPRLVASGYRYVADTEFIRAYCVIQNNGGGPSPSCTAVGEFVDWYGHPFACDQRSLPPLNPGESVDMTFFSMVHKDESHPNGVNKADRYTCQVRFVGPGLAQDGSAAKKTNPANSYRPSAAVKARVKSSNFHIESSTIKYTPGSAQYPAGTRLDSNGFPRGQP